MITLAARSISIVLPVYNEQAGIELFHKQLRAQLAPLSQYTFEIIYCDDGSQDGTLKVLQTIAAHDADVRLIRLSRNFGKELVITAGIQHARGAAVITLDSDGQHPVELIPKFIEAWEGGSKVVVGVRNSNQNEGFVKRAGSRLFYGLFNRFTGLGLMPSATDFRLIDAVVRDDFARLTEHNRISRGLIDWLGYERTYLPFHAKARAYDTPAYSFSKLVKLAVDSVISLSSSPLYVTAYIGAVVLPLSAVLAIVMLVDKLLGDPFGWNVTGTAYVSVLILFLLGIVLMSQGVIGLYLSHIHSETQNRPLYIVDAESSRRI